LKNQNQNKLEEIFGKFSDKDSSIKGWYYARSRARSRARSLVRFYPKFLSRKGIALIYCFLVSSPNYMVKNKFLMSSLNFIDPITYEI
jgi:hypothetical protein